MSFLDECGKLGFGCMRLPMKAGEVDREEFSKMVDAFLEAGFCYFDTAHSYLDGQSETALRDCLVSRYERERFWLTDKLTKHFFEKEEDIRPFFESQLHACGVTYFDCYLMHALSALTYPKYRECRAFEVAGELKAEGKIRHVGISFHDKAEVLDRILTEQPQIEVVQIQFNYADYENPRVESRKCYEVCRRHGKPVLVMEPVKGGKLAELPPEAGTILDALEGGSHASYAIRYAAGFEGVGIVLSGMSSMEQMEDNLGFMKEFTPLSQEERGAVEQVQSIFRMKEGIPCTACHYCTEVCPAGIAIPEIFLGRNARAQGLAWDQSQYEQNKKKAEECLDCGRCEDACPQSLKIRELLRQD